MEIKEKPTTYERLRALYQKETLSKSETAELIGIHFSSLDRLRKQGKGIPYLAIGMNTTKRHPQIRYKLTDIAEWLDSQTKKVY